MSYEPSPVVHRHRDDNRPLYDRVVDVVVKNGPFALLAAVLLYFLLGDLKNSNANLVHAQQTGAQMQQETLNELRSHASDSMWLMRQICINSAVQAGTRPELCGPERR